MLKRSEEKFIVRKRNLDLYQMVGNISIDGFKRERYVNKIKDLSDEIALTRS